jgi:hypothetical protein
VRLVICANQSLRDGGEHGWISKSMGGREVARHSARGYLKMKLVYVLTFILRTSLQQMMIKLHIIITLAARLRRPFCIRS